MYLYIYTALGLYVAAFAASLAGSLTASSVLGIAVVVLVGVVLAKSYGELRVLKDRHWDKISQFWLGGEYGVAIVLLVLSGVTAELLAAFLFTQLSTFFPAVPNAREVDMTVFLGLGMLAMGVVALLLVNFVALVYLVEVFTRDVYLLGIAAGAPGIRPHSATFYIVISVATLGFLYFYWLYMLWKWITQLKTSTQLPY